MEINITSTPEITTQDWGTMLYLEKKGPFEKTAMPAWKAFWQVASNMPKNNLEQVVGLSHVDCTKQGDEAFTYRAGAVVAPDIEKDGLEKTQLQGGKYALFELIGSYTHIPKAFDFAISYVADSSYEMRDDFCVEVYANSPEDTSEENLKTQIYIPIQ